MDLLGLPSIYLRDPLLPYLSSLMNHSFAKRTETRREKLCSPSIARGFLLAMALLATMPVLRAEDSAPSTSSHKESVYSSKHGVMRQYSEEDRVRYQLWNYTWKPDPNQPITRIEVRIGEQKVYVYQGDEVAGESPTTTGKPGHDTPTGHYTILVKDIDHKSNLYGVFLDSNGYIIDGNAEAGQKPPAGAVYDSADMPYYLRIRDDGTGLHAGYLPGYPASHGCIRLPHAFAELLFSNVSVGTPVDVVP
jgi:L,D-transpeptidase catalytic domain